MTKGETLVLENPVLKKFGIALVIVFALLGCYQTYGIVQQYREDYSNFRKIVQWVAIKQQQEELARQRAQQAAARPTPPAPPDGAIAK